MSRVLDLRTAEQVARDRQRARDRARPCGRWPGCDCLVQGTRGECEDEFGIFFDDEE